MPNNKEVNNIIDLENLIIERGSVLKEFKFSLSHFHAGKFINSAAVCLRLSNQPVTLENLIKVIASWDYVEFLINYLPEEVSDYEEELIIFLINDLRIDFYEGSFNEIRLIARAWLFSHFENKIEEEWEEDKILVELAGSEYWEVRIAVAEHINTPSEALIQLSKDEEPLVRKAVAEHGNTPAETLAELSKSEYWKIRKAVAEHGNTPSETLVDLAKDKKWEVRWGVARNINRPISIPDVLLLEDLENLRIERGSVLKEYEFALSHFLASKLINSAAVCLRLSNQPVTLKNLVKGVTSIDYIGSLLKYLPPDDEVSDYEDELLNFLINDFNGGFSKYFIDEITTIARAWLFSKFKNESILDWQETEIIAELAKDNDEDVRGWVARNENTPAKILSELAKDESERVRKSVAGNIYSCPKTLAILSNDESTEVRKAVANNRETPVWILDALSKDEDSGVRAGVAENPYTSSNTLAELANDEEWVVRCGVASNKRTPPKLLDSLAKDKMPLVRCSVARNRNTPSETLVGLSKDEVENVRYAVSENKCTPQGVLDALSKDEDWAIQLNETRKHSTQKS